MTLGTLKDDATSGHRRKLRPLIITMGGTRQANMEQLFSNMSDEFEPPGFSPGVPSRSLRNRFEFFRIAHEAGLVPEGEWEAMTVAMQMPEYELHPDRFFECLNDVPVVPGRKGGARDVKLHYSVELWQKSKSLNRGRAVMACLLAHLLAMKRCVEEGYDFILEDNVRAAPEECARRVWEAMDASGEWQQANGDQCHLRYYGWLGSLSNLHWVLNTHATRTAFARESTTDGPEEESHQATFFPFPITQDFDLSPEDKEASNESEDEHGVGAVHPPTFGNQKPGGTPIWGAYAYWISSQGLESLLDALRMDVGAMLWKGKRMRNYVVKPSDKVIPRQVMASLGRQCIHVTTCPAFFRAPMLTSKIHAQWDAEFCKSTEYQMNHSVLSWSDLWLSDTERGIVHHHSQTGNWLTMDELAELEPEHDGEQ
jgi:hypothetical protein